MSTTPTPAPNTTKLDEAISFLEAGAGWAAMLPVPGVAAAAAISEKILRLIQVAMRTHKQVTGEPLDISKLHELPHA